MEVNKKVMVLTGPITEEETQTIIDRIMVGLVILSLDVLHNLSVKYVSKVDTQHQIAITEMLMDLHLAILLNVKYVEKEGILLLIAIIGATILIKLQHLLRPWLLHLLYSMLTILVKYLHKCTRCQRMYLKININIH